MTSIIPDWAVGINMRPFGEVVFMKAFAYMHSHNLKVEKPLIDTFCKRYGIELVSTFMDDGEEDLIDRTALGTMLDHLQTSGAECALAVDDTGGEPRVQVRFCGYTNCRGTDHSGVCRSGFIGYPDMCIFQK